MCVRACVYACWPIYHVSVRLSNVCVRVCVCVRAVSVTLSNVCVHVCVYAWYACNNE